MITRLGIPFINAISIGSTSHVIYTGEFLKDKTIGRDIVVFDTTTGNHRCTFTLTAIDPTNAYKYTVTLKSGTLPTNVSNRYRFIENLPDELNPKNTVFELIYYWASTEAVKGTFTFADVDKYNGIPYFITKGFKFFVRPMIDNPVPGTGYQLSMPTWLYNEMGLVGNETNYTVNEIIHNGSTHLGVWYDNSYGKGFCPEYRNTTLIAAHTRWITAMATHVNAIPEIFRVNVGSIGHWGELHYHINIHAGMPFPENNIMSQYFAPYHSQFVGKSIGYRRVFQETVDNNSAVYNDLVFHAKQDLDWWYDLHQAESEDTFGHTQPAYPSLVDKGFVLGETSGLWRAQAGAAVGGAAPAGGLGAGADQRASGSSAR
jgi:hypothetical protein